MSEEKFDVEQGHGNHISSVVGEDEKMEFVKLLPSFLQDKDGKILGDSKEKIPCTMGADYPEKLRCVIIGNPSCPLHLSILIGCEIFGERHEVLAFYPEFEGIETQVNLTAVHEWASSLEATLEGTIGDGAKTVAFYDTRYAAHKKEYEIGKTYTFRLSAIAYRCDIVKERQIPLSGSVAEAFRNAFKSRDEYDENGNLKPLMLDMSKIIAFMQHSVAYPHEAEFQSPIVSVSEIRQFDRKYYVFEITIALSNDENAVHIPLVARAECLTESFQIGDPLRGVLWLQGFCVEKKGM